MRVIGLISGTSADAIDAALVAFPDAPATRPFELLAYRETALGKELQTRIHALAAGRLPGEKVLAELAALDVALGERFALAAIGIAEQAGVSLEGVAAVASHGQTVAHHPEHRATLQIADPSVIAERTGRPVVADFRPRDMAAGGEGAPLAPFFHYEAFHSDAESRVILNLGGIANVTWLPAAAAPEDVVAYDTGPANSLMDAVTTIWTQGDARCDRDGARARRGRRSAALLDELLDDAYLRRPPPKSTGRERYGLREAEALVRRTRAQGGALDDLLATLAAFTVESIVRSLREHLSGPPLGRVWVGGGGARNGFVMESLAEALGVPVEPVDVRGVPADAAEAMAFALMGRNALLGIPNHLPQTTGARAARVLGEFVPGESGRLG